MFKPYMYFHNRVEYTKNYNKNIFINITVDPSSLLNKLLSFSVIVLTFTKLVICTEKL
jgi:hypothetical protein